MKKLPLIILILCSIFFARAQSMQDLKTVAAFIYVQNGAEVIPYGTCFFVAIKSKTNQNGSYVYLVTAKHVLQDKKGRFLDKMFVRVNHKDSTSSFEPISLIAAGKNKSIFLNDDPSVDIAVVPITLKLGILKVGLLDPSFLSNREEFKNLNLAEGNEAFYWTLYRLRR